VPWRRLIERFRSDLGSVETEGCAGAHEGARVPELIAEVGRGEKEGAVLEAHRVDGGGATGTRRSG
jgi:hypothetical protein